MSPIPSAERRPAALELVPAELPALEVARGRRPALVRETNASLLDALPVIPTLVRMALAPARAAAAALAAAAGRQRLAARLRGGYVDDQFADVVLESDVADRIKTLRFVCSLSHPSVCLSLGSN